MTPRIAFISLLLCSVSLGQMTHERYVVVQDLPGESKSNTFVMTWVPNRSQDRDWIRFFERGGRVPSYQLPVMFDMTTGQEVPVTSTHAQARADLQTLDEQLRQAHYALKAFTDGIPAREYRRDVIRPSYVNVATNQSFTAAQRRILTDLVAAFNRDLDLTILQADKRAEAQLLNLPIKDSDQ